MSQVYDSFDTGLFLTAPVMKAEIKVDNHTQQWVAMQLVNLQNAMDAMAGAIRAHATAIAPRLSGDLRASSAIEKDDSATRMIRTISFGGGDVPYAAYQERGERFDGSHKVTHYTTAGTGAHYLQNAGDKAVKEGLRQYL